MIAIRLAGGLGNQMFNYAFAKFLQKHGYKVVVDISWFPSEGKKHSEGKRIRCLFAWSIFCLPLCARGASRDFARF